MSDPRVAASRSSVRVGTAGAKLLHYREKFHVEATKHARLWEQNYHTIVARNMQNQSEAAFRDKMLQLWSENHKEPVCQGLLYGFFTEPENSAKYFKALVDVINDNWYIALCNVNMMMFEHWLQMTTVFKGQIIPFFRAAIKASVPKIDNVIVHYVRYCGDGSTDFNNRVIMIRQVADMLNDKAGKEWAAGMRSQSSLFPELFITLIRLASDMQNTPANAELRNLLINTAFSIFTKKLVDVLTLGRDFLLVMMRTSRFTGFNAVWRDLYRNPQAFGGALKNLEEVLTRPPQQFVTAVRMSFPLQRMLEFMITEVRLNAHEKHLDWLCERHFKAVDNHSLRCETIRWLMYALPDKGNLELRAAIIYRLITESAPGAEMQYAKLHLWWDFYGFQYGEASMAIETAFMTLRYALNFQPAVANTWLEFCMKMIPVISPPQKEFIRHNVNTAWKVLAEKNGGAGAVQTVLESMRLDSTIRELCRTNLPSVMRQPLNQTPLPLQPPPTAPPPPPTISTPKAEGTTAVPESLSTPARDQKATPTKQPKAKSASCGATVSSASKNKLSASTGKDSPKRTSPKSAKLPAAREDKENKEREIEKPSADVLHEVEAAINELRGEVKKLAEDMKAVFMDETADNADRCAAIEKVVECVQKNDDLQDDLNQLEHLGQAIGALLAPLVPPSGTDLLPPELPTHEKLEASAVADVLSHPLYTVFRALSDQSARGGIATLISSIRDRDPATTYLLLFFLKVEEHENYPPSCYEVVSQDTGVETRLEEDLEAAAQDDRRLFGFLLPYVFKHYTKVACGSVGVYRVLCSYAHPELISDLIGEMVREDMSPFRKESFTTIALASMEWEAASEQFFWQLAMSMGVPTEWMYPMFAKLNAKAHPYAATQMLIQLKNQDANLPILKNVFMRPMVAEDNFAVNALKVMIEFDVGVNLVADFVSKLLKQLMAAGDYVAAAVVKSSSSNTSKSKGGKLSVEHVLFHLNELATRCMVKEKLMTEALLTNTVFRDAVQSVEKSGKAAALVSKFDRLFVLVQMLDSEKKDSSRSLRGNRAGTNRQAKRDPSSSEEEPKKKRVKPATITLESSDSD